MSFPKNTMVKGSGLLRPVVGSVCQIRVNCDETVCQHIALKDVITGDTSEITLGEWDVVADGIIHSCVQNMVEGEVSEIHMELDQSCPAGLKILDPHAGKNRNILKVEVTLCSFTKGKELWAMSRKERLDMAFHHKSRGTELFKNADKIGAFRRFSLAAKYLISMGEEKDIPDELRTEWKTLSAQVFLNMAACQLQDENHEAVIANCSKALNYDENNVKGYFRRAQSLCKLKDFENAKKDLLLAQKLEPTNMAVVKLLKDVESQQSSANSQMVNAMRKMFSS